MLSIHPNFLSCNNISIIWDGMLLIPQEEFLLLISREEFFFTVIEFQRKTLPAMITLSTVQLSTLTFFDNVILFMDTSNNV